MENFGTIPNLWNLDETSQTKSKLFQVWASINVIEETLTVQ